MSGYPGAFIADENRTPFGLGWEYRRRDWDSSKCPFPPESDESQAFLCGYKSFRCSDRKVDDAMLRDFRH